MLNTWRKRFASEMCLKYVNRASLVGWRLLVFDIF